MPVFYHSRIISGRLLNFSTSFIEEERNCLLRINVSLFEATEIQDRMNAQVTLQHLCTKFCKVSLCMHLQHTLPLYNYLSNAVPQVSVQQKPN